jgi:hypothetical protein
MIDHGFHGIDICGTHAGIAEESGFYAMRLVLRQGLTARISRIPAMFFSAGQGVAGARAAAFGIRSLETARSGSLPQNFSVVDVQYPRNSAYRSCLDIECAD